MNFKCNFRWYTKKLENNRTEKKIIVAAKATKNKHTKNVMWIWSVCVCIYVDEEKKEEEVVEKRMKNALYVSFFFFSRFHAIAIR